MAATKDEIHPSGVAKDLRDVLDRYWVQDSEGREQIAGTLSESDSDLLYDLLQLSLTVRAKRRSGTSSKTS